MKYMLLIYHDERALSESEREACYEESTQLVRKLEAERRFIAASPLQPAATTARAVRVRDGRMLVTDGPFAETKEQLGGYFLVEADDVEQAIGIAAQIPMARKGTVEVRPVVELAALAKG